MVDLPQGMIKGDTLVSRGGLSYSAFRSLFLHFDRFLSPKCVPQVSSICRGPSWRFKMGSPSAASCAGVGGDEEWKVIQEKLYITFELIQHGATPLLPANVRSAFLQRVRRLPLPQCLHSHGKERDLEKQTI